MDIFQDPHRQVGYLQQCLASDKKPLGLFLGAGEPVRNFVFEAYHVI